MGCCRQGWEAGSAVPMWRPLVTLRKAVRDAEGTSQLSRVWECEERMWSPDSLF